MYYDYSGDKMKNPNDKIDWGVALFWLFAISVFCSVFWGMYKAGEYFIKLIF